MMRKETAVIRKQNMMLPTVSIRAFPEGNRRESTLRTARLHTIRVIFERGSKTASTMVVKRDREPEETAPKICSAARRRFAAKEPCIAILYLRWLSPSSFFASSTCSSTGLSQRSMFSF